MTASDKLTIVRSYAFEDWRTTARRLLISGFAPEHLQWIDERQVGREGQSMLFEEAEVAVASPVTPSPFSVPRDFLDVARTISHHRSPSRWSLLYRILWRITGGEKHLLQIAADRDVVAARDMEKSVRRDAHKMKAFVRFKKTVVAGEDVYVAWHRSDHYVVSYTAGFFARRFDVMKWVIVTSDDSVAWNGTELVFGPGSPKATEPTTDEIESLWKTYYSHIFNPARIKLKAMKAEMPRKYWATMPETELIDELIRKSPQRVEMMIKQSEGLVGAEQFIPHDTNDLNVLRVAAQTCRGCPLHEPATQTVFGVGPQNAILMLIGEQPGDQEDRAGVPFVGPSGILLRECLEEVGIDIDAVYVTNAVKHFKFQVTPGRRLHVKPSSREIGACKPWLRAEVESIKPKMILCLGATPSSVIFGPAFRITQGRGQVMESDFSPWSMATYHPSALLRVPDSEQRASMTALFKADLKLTADSLAAMR